MMNNTIRNNNSTQIHGYTPQEAGEFFTKVIRDFDRNNNTQGRIEKEFFKRVCFYYFDIDQKTSLKYLDMYEEHIHGAIIERRRNDIQELLGEYFMQYSLHLYKKGLKEEFNEDTWKEYSRIYVQKNIQSIFTKIISTIGNTKDFAKTCHWFAKTLKDNWRKTYISLSTQDKILQIIPFQDFDSLESYIPKIIHKNLVGSKKGSRDPRAFQQAGIKSNDVLYYFFGLEQLKTPADVLSGKDIIRRILTIDRERKNIDLQDHKHQIITVDSIKQVHRNGKLSFITNCIYTEGEHLSSNFNTLLHNAFAHEQKISQTVDEIERGGGIDSNISQNKYIIKNKFEYMYKAIRDIQALIDTTNCTLPPISGENIHIEDMADDITKIYGAHIGTFFIDSLGNHTECSIKRSNHTADYLITRERRTIVVSCKEKDIILYYYDSQYLIGEQKISVLGDGYSISSYTAPQESALDHWCKTYGIDDYISTQENIELGQYKSELLSYIYDWLHEHKKVDTTQAYITYLLENCINTTIDLGPLLHKVSLHQGSIDTKQEVAINNFALSNISKEIYTLFAKGLYSQTPALESLPKETKEKNKITFTQLLHDLGLTLPIQENSFIDSIKDNRDNVLEASQVAHSHLIYGGRAYKSIVIHNSREKSTLKQLLQRYFIKRIATRQNYRTVKYGSNEVVKNNPLPSLRTVYELCSKYNILAYVKSKNSNAKNVENIISIFKEYNEKMIQKNKPISLSDNITTILTPEEQKRMGTVLMHRLQDITHKYCTDYLVPDIRIALLQTYKYYITADSVGHEKALKIYKAKLGVCKNILKNIYKHLFPTLSEQERDEKIKVFYKTRYIAYNISTIPQAEKSLQLLSLDSRIISLEALQASFTGDIERYSRLFLEHESIHNTLTDAVYKKYEINKSIIQKIQEKENNKKKLTKKDKSILYTYHKALNTIDILTGKIGGHRSIACLPKSIIENNIIVLYNIGQDAIVALEQQDTTLYLQHKEKFMNTIQEIKETIYSEYNIEDMPSCVHKTKLINSISEIMQQYTRLFPVKNEGSPALKASNKVKYKIIKNTHDGLQALIENNQSEYQSYQETHNTLLIEYRKQLEIESNITDSVGGKKNKANKVRDIGFAVDTYDIFPTEAKLGYKNIGNNITDNEFRIDFISTLFNTLPPHIQAIIQGQSIEGKIIGNHSLKVVNEVYGILKYIPYITDEYARAAIYGEGVYEKNTKTTLCGQVKEYMVRNLKDILLYTIKQKRTEEYITSYITIADPILKTLFIQLVDKIIIDILENHASDSITHTGTYENVLYQAKGGVFDKDITLKGTMICTLPDIDQQEKEYQSIEDLEYVEIQKEYPLQDTENTV